MTDSHHPPLCLLILKGRLRGTHLIGRDRRGTIHVAYRVQTRVCVRYCVYASEKC